MFYPLLTPPNSSTSLPIQLYKCARERALSLKQKRNTPPKTKTKMESKTYKQKFNKTKRMPKQSKKETKSLQRYTFILCWPTTEHEHEHESVFWEL